MGYTEYSALIMSCVAVAAMVIFLAWWFNYRVVSHSSPSSPPSPSGPPSPATIPTLPSSFSLQLGGVPVQAWNVPGPGYTISPGPSPTGQVFAASLGPISSSALPLPPQFEGVTSGVTLTDPKLGNLTVVQLPNEPTGTSYIMPLSVVPGGTSGGLAQFIPLSVNGGINLYEVTTGEWVNAAPLPGAPPAGPPSLAVSPVAAQLDVVS